MLNVLGLASPKSFNAAPATKPEPSVPPTLPPVLAAPPPPMLRATSPEAPRRTVRVPHKILTDTAAGWRATDEAVPARGERRPRLVSPDPSSSSSSGSLSDGDPPGYAPPTRIERSTSSSTRDDKPFGGPPSVAVAPAAGRRGYDELEDITFSNPASFKGMVFAIAATRGTAVRVSDDRTHKATSAYMHITCAYRNSGCPFILKLTKAKEGGWVMKSNKATDVDPKQRSNYRCRHPAGSIPDDYVPSPSATSAHPGSGTTSYPGPSGSKPKPARMAKKAIEKPSSASPPNHHDKDEDYMEGQNVRGERALAPPFARSISLQSRISPALAHQQPSLAGPHRHSDYRYQHSQPHQDPFTPSSSGHWGPSVLSPSPNLVPSYHAPARATTLSEWTSFLTALDPELVSIAGVLSSPALDVSPASFLAEPWELQEEFIGQLDIPSWPKTKLKAKIRKSGVDIWKAIITKAPGLAKGRVDTKEWRSSSERDEPKGEEN